MRQRTISLILLCFAVVVAIGQSLKQYEYWVDNDYEKRETKTNMAADISINIDGNTLRSGLHYFNVRAQNDRGMWGPLKRDFFYIPVPEKAISNARSYEYWVDNDYEHRISAASTEDAIVLTYDGSNLRPGLHYFNVRAQNDKGLWGRLKRDFFYIPYGQGGTEEEALINGYEYCIGGLVQFTAIEPCKSYDLKQHVISIPDLTSFGSLEEGCTWKFTTTQVTLQRSNNLAFSIRFRNSDGNWSLPAGEQFIMKDTIAFLGKNPGNMV